MHTISLANNVGRILAAVHSLYSTIVVRFTLHSVNNTVAIIIKHNKNKCNPLADSTTLV